MDPQTPTQPVSVGYPLETVYKNPNGIIADRTHSSTCQCTFCTVGPTDLWTVSLADDLKRAAIDVAMLGPAWSVLVTILEKHRKSPSEADAYIAELREERRNLWMRDARFNLACDAVQICVDNPGIPATAAEEKLSASVSTCARTDETREYARSLIPEIWRSVAAAVDAFGVNMAELEKDSRRTYPSRKRGYCEHIRFAFRTAIASRFACPGTTVSVKTIVDGSMARIGTKPFADDLVIRIIRSADEESLSDIPGMMIDVFRHLHKTAPAGHIGKGLGLGARKITNELIRISRVFNIPDHRSRHRVHIVAQFEGVWKDEMEYYFDALVPKS